VIRRSLRDEGVNGPEGQERKAGRMIVVCSIGDLNQRARAGAGRWDIDFHLPARAAGALKHMHAKSIAPRSSGNCGD